MPTPLLTFDAGSLPLADGAASFDGVADGLTRTDAGFDFSFPFAVSCHFRYAGGPGILVGVFNPSTGTWDGHFSEIRDDGRVSISSAVASVFDGVVSADPLTPGQWHHILWERPDAATYRLTIDGVTAEATGAALSPAGLTRATIGHSAAMDGIPRMFLEGAAKGVAFIRGTLTGAERAELRTSGNGGFSEGLENKATSWLGLNQATGTRWDRKGIHHFTPVGSPGFIADDGNLPISDPDRCTDGDRVTAIGDWAGEGVSGPTFRDYPERLLADSDGPGLTIATGGAPLVRSAFDGYVRVINTWGTGGRLITCDDGAGIVATLDLDAGNILTFSITGPGGSGSASAAISLYGSAAVTGGSAVAGTTKTALTLTTSVRLDAEAGDHVEIAGCGAPYDGDHVLLGAYWDEVAEVGTYRYQAAGTSGVGATPTAGKITLKGRLEETAWKRDTDYVQTWPAVVRVVRNGDRVDFYEKHHHLGGATVSGLPSAAGTTGTTTLGSRAGDDATPVAELPGIVDIHASDLADPEAYDILAKCCARRVGVDDYAGRPVSIAFESLPGLWRSELVHADVVHEVRDRATGRRIVGRQHGGDSEGLAEGASSAQLLGGFTQAAITNYDYWLHVATPTWSQAGARATKRFPFASHVASITRRPYLRTLSVSASGGADYTNIYDAATRAAPGTLITVAPGTYGQIYLEGAAPSLPPLSVASDDGGTWDCTGLVNLADTRGLLMQGLRVVHTAAETSGVYAVNVARTVGLTLDGNRDAVDGSTHGPYAVFDYDTRTDDLTIHDMVIEYSAVYIQYGIALFGSARHGSFRRLHFDRPHSDGNHLSRINSPCYHEFAGLVHRPSTPSGDGPTVTHRGGIRRATIRDCDVPTQDVGFDAVGVDYSGAANNVIPVGVLMTRIACKKMPTPSASGMRITSVMVAQGTFGATFVYQPEVAIPTPKSITIEGCVSPSLPVTGDETRAAPTTGNRRNLALIGGEFTTDTGVTLEAPSLAVPDGEIPDGLAVAVMDGLPMGGHGLKRPVAVLDGVELAGWSPGLLASPADAGSHTLRIDVTDDAGAVAIGGILALTVAEDDPDEEPPPDPDPPSITPPLATLDLGGTLELDAGGFSSGILILWESSDVDVVAVDASGVISALAPGSATITATAADLDGLGISHLDLLDASALDGIGLGDGTADVATATITVPTPSVVVTPGTLTLVVGRVRSGQFMAAVAGIVDQSITWSSSDESVVTVDAFGLARLVGEGEATITATLDAYPGASDTVAVTVEPNPNPARSGFRGGVIAVSARVSVRAGQISGMSVRPGRIRVN